jgi:methyl-accepting chemotaxis protein
MNSENCWELVKCGREEMCPAYPHHGRECFAVTATMCRGEEQGSYQEKIQKCRDECKFYKHVMGGDDF